MSVIGTIIRGDYEVVQATITEPNPVDPGEERIRDITNDTFVFTARRDPASPSAFATKSVGSGITKTSPTNGKLEVELLPADTRPISRETILYCDIQGTMASGRPYTTLFELRVKPDITTS